MAAGAALALVHAFFSIHLRADQIVSGTAINFLALGVTGYFFIDIYGEQGTPGDIPRIPDVNLPLDKIPTGLGDFLDDVFGQLNLMIWLSFVLLIVSLHRHLQDADRAADPRRRRASAGGRHGRHLRLRDALRRRDRLRASSPRSGGAYLSIGFLTRSTRT